ncbi:MAG: ATP phosphoribosyltransferase regulatory subunit [Rhodobacteraceae bacterium]|jgi:ATP phosphoribosyltransferase regulatory subunit|uniref:ATP phosphoribosyltransferase regulatory subunit n=1 Tax=Salipiger profundus TaxID=1229727 RepID=A0A1U7D607_9RHOB|nr:MULTISPECIES: ATP phosphoribosyltransferase regulatory subunit [Salipiger]APX23542.1 ATP phosphoribosyltransferase regulatory subunit [Salipiger profundus]MAB08689.1 ATP phosphoribosyltransferase regulatory subunit [Paracoccaceae bacterium]GGA21014.1 ATP phosphoribosyltransferase regulatory subunit [Salipiger profundus]SFC78466.1 ATP phosphoribosyltransferase regulatory subunit [Salipiger profundus]
MGVSIAEERAEAVRLRAAFVEAGATNVDCAILQSAETLLDLYGEDIRARAYVTQDPARGEVMLRPDFTVPVVQMHMETGAAPSRYTYCGEVFRRQEDHPERASEYFQVGYELFADNAPAQADAEVFARFADTLAPYGLRAVTGDIGILTAAVRALKISDRRRAALMRHIWRPRRFRALLDRYSGRTPVPPTRKALLGASDPMAEAGNFIGLRSETEVAERIAALHADAAEGPLCRSQVQLIDTLLAVRETCPFALEHLHDIAVDLPGLLPAVEGFERRCEAMAAQGIDVDRLDFEASYGRTSMEYYDGFVFGFLAPKRPDLPPIATGGRYDALTERLGQGRAAPAVGGVIRPGLLLQLGGAA